MLRFFLIPALVALGLAAPATAQSFDRVVQAEVLPGWRSADGSHMAALRITLNPGWKTYWRAPGDAGIPPHVDWGGSRNLAAAELSWPTPVVFEQNGMRSIGYQQELILPVRVTPRRAGQPVRLNAQLDIGVCRDICVPAQLTVQAELPAQGQRDARIAAALANRPLSAAEAGLRGISCRLSPTADGLRLTVTVDMPSAGAPEIAVVETADPQIWVAEGTSRRQGGRLVTETEMMHVSGDPFIVDRSGVRVTVLGSRHAVDIQGCAG